MRFLANLYDIASNLFLLGFGIYLLVFQDHFIRGNQKVLAQLHQRTGWPIFLARSEDFGSFPNRIVITALSLLFVGGSLFVFWRWL